MAEQTVPPATPGRILRLALPALGVLAAEPLYLLYDFAVVGRLGALPLAGLAIGGLILAQVTTQLTFLSYGTTARAARHHGAGDRSAAVAEGIQATWLAIGIGVGIIVVVSWVAGPVIGVLSGDPAIAEPALAWLRVAILGAPLILIAMAGNGWLRGVHDTVRPLVLVATGLGVSAILCPVLVHGLLGAPAMGLVGSAVANVIGQACAALLFLGALHRERQRSTHPIAVRPRPDVMRAQVVLGRDLIIRSLAFQACFISAAAVAARFGASSVAAHQLMLHLWNLIALMLDSLAIAAQALIGAALGGGATGAARAMTWRITRWSVVFALVLATAFALGHATIPALLTDDPGVLGSVASVWWVLVLLVPVAGVVFALDGVLLGSGDAAFLRTATVLSAVLAFLPMIWLSLLLGWGLPGIWAGLAAFLCARAGTVVWRARGDRWLVVGADRQERSPRG
ncbi:MATE family efflux transporter [Lolliginicoccus suaedae]|uniref:MATE family efflux transporter n=1 Tax=Lolliginicoccus suaedae TaxID=2605429 RepID=UPI001F16CB05|nr:MATE family efflux transporter [Lolliginicoccus suaedae]